MDPLSSATDIIEIVCQSSLDRYQRAELVERITALVAWAEKGGGLEAAMAELDRYLRAFDSEPLDED